MLIAFSVSVGLVGEPVLHPLSRIGLGGQNQRMNLTGHRTAIVHHEANAFSLPLSRFAALFWQSEFMAYSNYCSVFAIIQSLIGGIVIL